MCKGLYDRFLALWFCIYQLPAWQITQKEPLRSKSEVRSPSYCVHPGCVSQGHGIDMCVSIHTIIHTPGNFVNIYLYLSSCEWPSAHAPHQPGWPPRGARQSEQKRGSTQPGSGSCRGSRRGLLGQANDVGHRSRACPSIPPCSCNSGCPDRGPPVLTTKPKCCHTICRPCDRKSVRVVWG